MKTEWDYTELADAYVKRPGYAPDAIKKMLELSGVNKGDRVCDVGAGAAHLTIELAKAGLEVSAIEPNDAMRSHGIERTARYPNVFWYEGVGEKTGMQNDVFKLVTFGSSFNVCDRGLALIEVKRILEEKGWFACMWNYRDLNDPLQKRIEEVCQKSIDGYVYGTRREDQTEIINASNLYGGVIHIECQVVYDINVQDFIEGWRSHGTLQRQAKEKFSYIVSEIEKVIMAEGTKTIRVPYTTKVWMAQAK